MSVMYFKIIRKNDGSSSTYKFNKKDKKFEEFLGDVPNKVYQVVNNQIDNIIGIIGERVEGPRGEHYYYAEISKKDGTLRFGSEQGNYSGGITSYLCTSPIKILEQYKKSDRKFWELIVEEYTKINLKINQANYAICPKCKQEVEYYSHTEIACNNCLILFKSNK